jgi:WD40 repeat protein
VRFSLEAGQIPFEFVLEVYGAPLFQMSPTSKNLQKPQLVVQKRHALTLNSVAISPDNNFVLTCGFDGALLWDIKNGRQIRHFRETELFPKCAFSPKGESVVMSHSVENAMVWDIKTGSLLGPFGKGAKHGVHDLDFSWNGRWMVTANADGARLWDVETRIQRQFFQSTSAPAVSSVAFSPDDRIVLTGHDDGLVRFWEKSSGRKLRSLRVNPEWVRDLKFSPNGRSILAGGRDGVSLWDTETGSQMWARNNEPTMIRRAIAFSPKGHLIATNAGDHNGHYAYLLDPKSGAVIRSIYAGAKVTDLAFSPDGASLLISNSFGAGLWAVSTGLKIRRFEGETSWVDAVAYSSDSQTILVGSHSKVLGNTTVTLWDTTTGARVHNIERRHLGDILSMGISPDNRYIFAGSKYGVLLWDTYTRKELRGFENTVSSVSNSSATFSRDGKLLATAQADTEGTVNLWDVATEMKIQQFNTGKWISSLSLSPDGSLLSTVHGTVIRVWDTKSGTELRSFNGIYGQAVVAFSQDGDLIASGNDVFANFWSTAEGFLVNQIRSDGGQISTISLDPVGRFVLLGHFSSSRAALWDVTRWTFGNNRKSGRNCVLFRISIRK